MRPLQEQPAARFWEVDFMRGIAIVMMVAYHFFFDLDFFGAYPIDTYSGFWWYLPRAIGAMFVSLVGVSLALSYSRERLAAGRKSAASLYPKYLKRGIMIFSWGMLIALITWLLFPEGAILFGVLHLIGASIALAYPFLRIGKWSFVPGAAFIAAGIAFMGIDAGSMRLFWLGLRPHWMYSLDYYPLFPWFGAVLVGISAGGVLYANYERAVRIPDLSRYPPVRFLCFLGRHSLAVYLLHQPVLLFFLYLVGIANLAALRIG